jgi:hypothetical protein
VEEQNSSHSGTFDRLGKCLEAGKGLTAEQASKLEVRLVEDPNDLNTRLQLIAFYRGKDDSAVNLRITHILWLIENHSNSPVWRKNNYTSFEDSYSAQTFSDARTIWLRKIEEESSNSQVWGNAGLFLIERDFELGTILLTRATELDTNDYAGSYWPERLSMIHYVKALAENGSNRIRDAKKCLWAGEVFLQRHGLDGMRWRSGIRQMGLERALLSALWLDDTAKASNYAHELNLVIKSWNHMPKSSLAALSIFALHTGDVAGANSYFLNNEEDPSLDELDIELANQLIQAGQRKSVLRYLSACKLHGISDDKVDAWICDLL